MAAGREQETFSGPPCALTFGHSLVIWLRHFSSTAPASFAISPATVSASHPTPCKHETCVPPKFQFESGSPCDKQSLGAPQPVPSPRPPPSARHRSEQGLGSEAGTRPREKSHPPAAIAGTARPTDERIHPGLVQATPGSARNRRDFQSCTRRKTPDADTGKPALPSRD